MDNRLESVLNLLIDDYIRTAEPIGSSALVKSHELDVSSATVRNCFSVLEDEGYLIQPHTSAGRIPTEKAYHWYVERLDDSGLKKQEEEMLRESSVSEDEDGARMKQLAKICVRITGSAALVGTNRTDTYYTGLTELFSQPEFKDWSKVVNMGTVLDDLDGRLNALRTEHFSDPEIRLGKDCPFGSACGSVMVSLPKRGLLVLLGPIRMDYRKARGILLHISQFTNA